MNSTLLTTSGRFCENWLNDRLNNFEARKKEKSFLEQKRAVRFRWLSHVNGRVRWPLVGGETHRAEHRHLLRAEAPAEDVEVVRKVHGIQRGGGEREAALDHVSQRDLENGLHFTS